MLQPTPKSYSQKTFFSYRQRRLKETPTKTPTLADYYPQTEGSEATNGQQMKTNTGTTSSGTGLVSAPDPDPGQTVPSPRLLYYYHPDYLGNVEYITDADGLPYQYFFYSPWGEALKDQKANTNATWDSPYRFNGKEQDEETGLYYYGARYYNPQISVWLSVDAMAHLSPSQTPYHFVSNNPILRVDPDGNKDLIFYEDGSYKETTNDNWWHNLWHGARGKILDADGNTKQTFKFNDRRDARIENWEGENKQYDGVDLRFESKIESIVNKGIEGAPTGYREKLDWIVDQSSGDASRTGKSDLKLDFVLSGDYYNPDKLYLAGDRAYNDYDAGNFLWGHALGKLEIGYLVAKLGSEWNAFYYGKIQYNIDRKGNKIEGIDPNKFSFKRITWFGDSKADQRAIRKGYFYNRK